MVTVLVLSGGNGTRMGLNIPKQYIKVNDRTVISYCLESFLTHEMIDAVQIVADEAWRKMLSETVKQLCQTVCRDVSASESDQAYRESMRKLRGFSTPGRNRQYSILNGLKDIRKYAGDSDYVLIHDAARPCVSAAQITDCLKAAKGHDGTLPVLPMKDTVYLSEDGKAVSSLLDREKVFAGQAPEVFLLGRYYEANRVLLPDRILEINGSTEPAVMAGMDIAIIPGDERNFKITTAADLERFREIVQKGGCAV